MSRVPRGHAPPDLGAVHTRVDRSEPTWDSYKLDVTNNNHKRKISSPENADCCLADLLFVSTGVIRPLLSELKFVVLDEDDLPKSSGVKPLLTVLPYRSSIPVLISPPSPHIWH